MRLDEKTVDLLQLVDSNSAVPGGGSVSSLVAALGVCLARMYGHLTINKKKFLMLDETIQKEFMDCFQKLLQFKTALILSFDHDCDVYDAVMKAYRLPKETKAEQDSFQLALTHATYQAIDSPYLIMKEALGAMHLCLKIVDYGNKNAISDLACGVIFLDAAIQGASLNVKINLSSLNESEKQIWIDKINYILEESQTLKQLVLEKINL